MRLPDGKEESDTERNGFLSYAGEWHALGIGFFKGFVHYDPRPKHPDSRKELQYYGPAYVLGYLFKLPVLWLMSHLAL